MLTRTARCSTTLCSKVEKKSQLLQEYAQEVLPEGRNQLYLYRLLSFFNHRRHNAGFSFSHQNSRSCSGDSMKPSDARHHGTITRLPRTSARRNQSKNLVRNSGHLLPERHPCSYWFRMSGGSESVCSRRAGKTVMTISLHNCLPPRVRRENLKSAMSLRNI